MNSRKNASKAKDKRSKQFKVMKRDPRTRKEAVNIVEKLRKIHSKPRKSASMRRRFMCAEAVWVAKASPRTKETPKTYIVDDKAGKVICKFCVNRLKQLVGGCAWPLRFTPEEE